MLASLSRTAPTLLLIVSLSGCGGSAETDDDAANAGASGEEISVADSSALRWGEGDYGVVLAHGAAFDAASWQEQAVAIADQGASVIAVDDIGPDTIRAAVEQLQGEGVADVALVGGSAGADAILDLVSQEPDVADQLILLSPNATVDGLGEEPKLFVASEDEPVAYVSTELAASSPGSDNVAKILPGSAHAQNIFTSDKGPEVLRLMLERLEQFASQ